VRHEFRWKTGTEAFLLGSFTEWKEEVMKFEFDTQEHSLVGPRRPALSGSVCSGGWG
jgi:hypothetical protein